jgi:hypothetical protein
LQRRQRKTLNKIKLTTVNLKRNITEQARTPKTSSSLISDVAMGATRAPYFLNDLLIMIEYQYAKQQSPSHQLILL